MKIVERKIENVSFISLDNEKGMFVVLSTLGASIYQLEVADKEGRMESVVLTPTNLNDFYTSTGYFGKSVGRFSGRIDDSKCTIDGVTYHLERNWGGVNALHGESNGISFKNFDYEIKENEDSVDVIFTYHESEKDINLPGDVDYTFIYTVSKTDRDLTETFKARTNKTTIVNLTNHAYFNLSGNGKRNVKDELLQFNCDKYTNLNENLITDSIDPVNKVFDFTKKHEVGKYIYDESLQKHRALGYDHCWIKTDENEPVIAILEDKVSKRRLTVSTSYPAVVCYANCYPADCDFNVAATKIEQYHSVCLECQFIPNGINMEGVDKALLKPGEEYNHYIKYHFDIIK